MLHDKAHGGKYSETLAEDLSKFTNKCEKVLKMLNLLCTGKSTNEKELPKLIESSDALINEFGALQDWPSKFGFTEKASSKKRFFFGAFAQKPI